MIKFFITILLITSIIQIQIINSYQTPSQSHIRRILHQPDNLPNNILSSSPVPSPSPHLHHKRKRKPKNGSLSFPSGPSLQPFPPSAADSLPTMQANISSLTFSDDTSSSKTSSKLIAIVISLALFSVAVVAFAIVFLILHRGHHRLREENQDTEVTRSDSVRLFPPSTHPSDVKSPPPQRPPPPPPLPSHRNPPTTLTNIFYDGRLSVDEKANNLSTSSSISGYRKFDSPELRPLPPLTRQNLCGKQYYYSSPYEGNLEEEFFSPIGFSGTPMAEVSSSGSMTGAEFFRSHSLNSGIVSYPSNQSASYTRTVSCSPSVASNLTTSPDSIKFLAPFRPTWLPPVPQSPPPGRNTRATQNSRDKVSNGRVHVQVKLPPIPPPLPPPRFWEMSTHSQGTSNASPELGSQARPFAEVQNPVQNITESREKSHQILKPKLKPLHWDKVRASSDRQMVWDQLKSSSFQ